MAVKTTVSRTRDLTSSVGTTSGISTRIASGASINTSLGTSTIPQVRRIAAGIATLTVDDLVDVNLETLEDGALLKYNKELNRWEASKDLDDVRISAADVFLDGGSDAF